MGSFYGAEICEQIGLYLLDNNKVIINPKHIALYRDDGLARVNNHYNAALERVCGKLWSSVTDIGFNITTEPGLKIKKFLVITLNLTWL